MHTDIQIQLSDKSSKMTQEFTKIIFTVSANRIILISKSMFLTIESVVVVCLGLPKSLFQTLTPSEWMNGTFTGVGA